MALVKRKYGSWETASFNVDVLMIVRSRGIPFILLRC